MKSSLKEINGRYYMPAKVVMLSTEKATNLFKFKVTGKLFFSYHPNQNEYATCKHLYITSDEVIKEEDLVLMPDNTIHKMSPSDMIDYLDSQSKATRKIIASTDRTLGLPQPSQSFIKAYIEDYDSGNVITDVLVEYIEDGEEGWEGDSYTGQPVWREHFKLKVDSDNTITIKKVKDSYTTEEVIELLNKLGYDLSGNGYILDSNLKVKPSWLERNL